MVFNEASQPTHDQAKPKLADNSPRGIRQKALGITDLQITPFGKWLYHLHEEISDEQGSLEKKAIIEARAKQEIAKLNQAIDVSLQKDPRGHTQDKIDEVINAPDLKDRLFSYDVSNILSPDYDQFLGYAQFFIDKLRTIKALLHDKDFVEKHHVVLPVDGVGKFKAISKISFESAKNLTALTMAVHKMFPMSSIDNNLHTEIKNVLSTVSSGEMPIDYKKEASDFSTLFLDKEQELTTLADFNIHTIIADQIGRQKLIEIFDIRSPDAKKQLAESSWGQVFSNSTALSKQIHRFDQEITGLKTILEGGIPDPAAELTDKIKQEIVRLKKVGEAKGEEIGKLEEALRLAKQQQAEADNGASDLESVMPELAEISQQAQETKRKKIEADLLKKSLPDQIKPNTVLLSDSLLSNPEQLKQIVGNSDFLNALFSLYNLDAQAQQVIAQNFNAISGLLPLMENSATAESILGAVKTIFQQIKQTIGLNEIAKIEASLADLENPIEPVSLDPELEQKAQTLLQKAQQIR